MGCMHACDYDEWEHENTGHLKVRGFIRSGSSTRWLHGASAHIVHEFS
jgi:hypothetical protein